MTTGDMLKMMVDFRDGEDIEEHVREAAHRFALTLLTADYDPDDTVPELKPRARPATAKEKTDAGDFDPDDIPF